MADRYSVEPAKLYSMLKNTVFKGASDEELMALTVVSNEYKLNPMLKEIYAFPAKGGGIVPVVSVDGWTKIMNDHPEMDGLEFEDRHDENGKLVSCTAIIYRKDRSKPTKVTEYISECRRNTDPWKMEHRMLRHKALSQGARIAFGFSGIYDEDEAEKMAVVTAVETVKPVQSFLPSPASSSTPLKKITKVTKEAKPTVVADSELVAETSVETSSETNEDDEAATFAAEAARANDPHEADVAGIRKAISIAGIPEADFVAFCKRRFRTKFASITKAEIDPQTAAETHEVIDRIIEEIGGAK